MCSRLPRQIGVLAALAGLAGCGGAQKDAAPEVASVEFRGNRALDDTDLEDGLATRAPGWLFGSGTRFDRRDLDDDTQRIERRYRERGYFGASVTDVEVDDSEPGEVSIAFRIDEGEPIRLADLRFDGAPAEPDVDAEALARVAGLAEGRRFDHAAYLAAKEKLLSHLLNRGFAHAEVRGQVRVQPSQHRAVVVFDIDAGPRVSFGPLEVTGLEDTPRSAVENRLAWQEGDVYRPTRLAVTRARLRTLGFYSTVRVAVDDEGRRAEPPAQVAVVEAPRNTVRLGAGVAIDRIRWGVRGLASYSRLGAVGPLTKLNTEVRPGYVVLRDDENTQRDSGPEVEARVGLEKHDFLVPLVHGSVGVDYAVRQLETYSSRGPTFRTKLSRSFADGLLYTGLAYQIQSLEISSINEAIEEDVQVELGLASPYRLAMLEQTLALDGRDDAVRPRLGYYAAIKVQEAAAPLGSEFSFVTAIPELRGFVPLGDRVVIAALARWSQLVVGDKLPITRRFFGGGATSHRGFSQRRLSPVATSVIEDPDMPGQTKTLTVGIGGQAMFESSLEARFDVMTVAGQTLGLVAFVDAGDVTLDAGELDPLDPHIAAGGGLRLYTPIGPLRFDVGYRLNRFGDGEPDSDQRLAYHLTLGEAF